MVSTRTADPPQSPDEMTAAQLERRRRLLRAVVDLVADGYDDEMQMKDIADRAGVALGTVYRYFSSKEHLIAAALLEWAAELDRRPTRPPSLDLPPAERLSAALRRALRSYQREPAFARLLVMVAHSTDSYASESYRQMGPVVFSALGRAVPDLDDDTRARVLMVVGAVWYHCLVEWINARMTIGEVNETLDTTCHLVLDDRRRG
jgi:TetR/AcrR family transcriptional regulator, cholesterol catabolism regulator